MKARPRGPKGWRPSPGFIAIVGALVLGAAGWYVEVMYLAPGIVARAFLRAEAEHSNQRAFRLVSERLRVHSPDPELMDRLGALYVGRLPEGASLEMGPVHREAGSARVEFTVRGPTGASVRTDELQLVREGVRWRVDFVP